MKLHETNFTGYDVIVTTQKEFETLISSPTWRNAKKVCFVGNGRDFKFTKNDGKGCLIPQSVKVIQGFYNATIEVSNLSDDCQAGLYYAKLPRDNGYCISDIRVEADGLTNVIGFLRCRQLIECTSTATATSPEGRAYAFDGCRCLTNCSGEATANLPIAFNFSKNLVNCTGSAMGLGLEDCACCFYTCKNLVNCTGYATGTRASGFLMCTQLVACTGNAIGVTSTKNVICESCSFVLSNGLTNCIGKDYEKYAFSDCTGLVNCVGPVI